MLPDLDGTAWGDLLDACRNHGDVEMAVPTAEGGTIGCLYVQGSSSISMLQLPNRTRSHLLAVRVKEQVYNHFFSQLRISRRNFSLCSDFNP